MRFIWKCIVAILKKIKDFFAGEKGQDVLKKGAVAGAAAVGAAAVGFGAADRKAKKAVEIKERAVKKHQEARDKVESVLQDLGEVKGEVYKGLGDLAKILEKIQERPEFNSIVDGMTLPAFQLEEFKKLAVIYDILVGGVGGMAAGGAVGVGLLGAGPLMAAGPGLLAGGSVLCVMAVKKLKRAAETVDEAKKIQAEADRLVTFYAEIEENVKKYQKELVKVKTVYDSNLAKVQKTIEKKDSWEDFSKREKAAAQRAVELAQILYGLCEVSLTREGDHGNDEVNKAELNRAISDAEDALKHM